MLLIFKIFYKIDGNQNKFNLPDFFSIKLLKIELNYNKNNIDFKVI